jgi:putative Mn2+ efflux pump MntP
MPFRIAAAMSLVAFAMCLIMGTLAGNAFSTVVLRAMGAMLATLIVGLILGAMGQKMIQENVNNPEKNPENSESNSTPRDR